LSPKDKRGYTPLHLVAKTANEKVMIVLLEAGVPVNERGRKEVNIFVFFFGAIEILRDTFLALI